MHPPRSSPFHKWRSSHSPCDDSQEISNAVPSVLHTTTLHSFQNCWMRPSLTTILDSEPSKPVRDVLSPLAGKVRPTLKHLSKANSIKCSTMWQVRRVTESPVRYSSLSRIELYTPNLGRISTNDLLTHSSFGYKPWRRLEYFGATKMKLNASIGAACSNRASVLGSR